MSERPEIIQRRILQIEDRLRQIAAQLEELNKRPARGPRFVRVLVDLSRRPALEEERDALIEQRSKLEREYDTLPESIKS
jgi:predicted  nucleic acid-binding Zn-ribbon protein